MALLKTDPLASHIHLVCSADRVRLYEGLATILRLELRIAASAVEALHATVADPGRAILIDMASTLHAGVSESARLFDLGIAIPILRCTQNEAGAWTAMCQAPFKRLPLPVALREIAQGDASWTHPKFVRRYARAPLVSRVRFRVAGSQGEWHRGNTLNASAGGIFLLTQQVESIGSELELDLFDVPEVGALRGDIVWASSWDDAPRLPGMGIHLDPATVSQAYRKHIADQFTRREG